MSHGRLGTFISLHHPCPSLWSLLFLLTSLFLLTNTHNDPHNLRFQRLRIHKHQFPSLRKFRHGNQSDRLALRTLNLSRVKFRLRADEEEMRTGVHDKWVIVLEGVAPCIQSAVVRKYWNWDDIGRCERGQIWEDDNLHSVSGAVGATHRHLHIASNIPSLSSLSTYLNTSSTFCPPVPSTFQPSISPSHGLVTVSNQPGSAASPALGGIDPYVLA